MFVFSLVACMAAGLGGEETDGVADGAAFAGWDASSEGTVGDDAADTGADTAAPELVATWVDGVIHCSHAMVASACSAPPEGRGWTIDGTLIDVAYATYTDGDAPCAFTVDYDITGEFAAGTWTVRANGDEATVVVP